MARILIVDDSPVARRTLGNILIPLGHTVVGEASDGVQALMEYDLLKPDVVTMDLSMGGSGGAQAISDIIAKFPDARIVVVSARQDEGAMLDALERGARHFIVKPAAAEMLASVLDNVMQQNFDEVRRQAMVANLKSSFDRQTNKTAESHPQMQARVLIVDDSAVARKTLKEIVMSLGYVVVGEASNGAQAFVEYTKLRPDIVTMDLTMQGLGGAEATSKIVAAYLDARIVVISAMETRTGIIDALERGARHFIIKPVQPEKVAAVLRSVLSQEFDLQKHIEYVRKLKEAEGTTYVNPNGSNLPPYAINAEGNSLVQVLISESLTATSCQSLITEIEEHLDSAPRVLFDFGAVSRLDEKTVAKLSELILAIQNRAGVVRAISNNRRFVELMSQISEGNLLTDVLRYMEY